MRLGGTELILVIGVILVLFGGTLIPKIMKNVRKSGAVLKDEIEKTKEEFASEEETDVKEA